MKFLCENCKAKYQIADDKVAGRTVRMKCRKCGHLIEVTASVTETSVASKMPQEIAPGLPPGAPIPRPEATPGVTAGGPIPPPPRPQASPGRATPPPRPPGPGPRTPPPPKPAGSPAAGGLAGAFSKAVVAPPNEAPSVVSAAMAVLST